MFSIQHPCFEFKLLVNFDNQQLVEIALSLNRNLFVFLFRRDGFDFDEIIAQSTVRTLGSRFVTLYSECDLSKKLA